MILAIYEYILPLYNSEVAAELAAIPRLMLFASGGCAVRSRAGWFEYATRRFRRKRKHPSPPLREAPTNGLPLVEAFRRPDAAESLRAHVVSPHRVGSSRSQHSSPPMAPFSVGSSLYPC